MLITLNIVKSYFNIFRHIFITCFNVKLSLSLFHFPSTEANDLALHIAECVTGHTEVISLEGAYHGHSKHLIGLSTYKLQQQKEKDSSLRVNPRAWVVSDSLCFIFTVHVVVILPRHRCQTALEGSTREKEQEKSMPMKYRPLLGKSKPKTSK